MRDMLLVLNFDNDASRTITRKLRSEKVFCKIVPGSISLEEIRAQDAKLKDVTDRLKPGAVLSMIRDGVNPMKLTLDELKQELDQRQQDGEAPAERYARFLMQLERSGEITEEERSSYIGIYRLFRQLKKTDHAAIGSVLEEGGEMVMALMALLAILQAHLIFGRGDDAAN